MFKTASLILILGVLCSPIVKSSGCNTVNEATINMVERNGGVGYSQVYDPNRQLYNGYNGYNTYNGHNGYNGYNNYNYNNYNYDNGYNTVYNPYSNGYNSYNNGYYSPYNNVYNGYNNGYNNGYYSPYTNIYNGYTNGYNNGYNSMTEEQNRQRLRVELAEGSNCLNGYLNGNTRLNDNQWGALTSWARDVGCDRIRGSSLLVRLNRGEDPNTVAAQELPRWQSSGRFGYANSAKLRNEEINLFRTPSAREAYPVCQ